MNNHCIPLLMTHINQSSFSRIYLTTDYPVLLIVSSRLVVISRVITHPKNIVKSMGQLSKLVRLKIQIKIHLEPPSSSLSMVVHDRYHRDLPHLSRGSLRFLSARMALQRGSTRQASTARRRQWASHSGNRIGEWWWYSHT